MDGGLQHLFLPRNNFFFWIGTKKPRSASKTFWNRSIHWGKKAIELDFFLSFFFFWNGNTVLESAKMRPLQKRCRHVRFGRIIQDRTVIIFFPLKNIT